MMKALINNQRKIIINTIKTQPLKNYVVYFVSIAVIGFFLFLLSKGVWSVADAVKEPVLAGLLSYGSLMIIGLIILLGLPQVFKHLYSATDLGLLFTLPIPTRYIFWIKYIQSFIGVPLFAYVFFAVPLFVYGIATGASLLYYPILLIVLLAVTLIGLSIAYLANLLVVQVVPASKANEFMTVMSFLSGILVYVMIMLPNMMNDKPVSEMLLSGLPLFPEWTPMSWISVALVSATNGTFEFIVPLVLILLLAAFSILLTSTLVEKGFRTGWIRLNEGGGKKKKKRHKGTSHKVHHPIIAIGKKEWLAIKRDIREWLVFMPVAFFVVFGLIGFLSSGGELGDMRGASDISWPIAQGVLLFLYAAFNGQVSASSVGREGNSAWILQALPLSGKNIAYGKLWISWLLPFVLLTVIEVIIGIFLGWSFLQFAAGITMKLMLTVGISAIGLWLGTFGAKYNPTNPQARLKFGTSILLLALSYVYLFILFIPFVYVLFPVDLVELPAGLEHGLTGFIGMIASVVLTLLSWKASYPVLMIVVGVIVMILLSLVITILFTNASAGKYDKGVKIDMVSETSSKALFGKKKPGGGLY